jgi:5-methylcytosine-specific restriction protein B
MIIPKNITEEHVLQAIQDIDENGIKYPLTKSKKYDLVYNGKTYPPKYTISIANQFANGKYLTHKEFNTYQAQAYLKNLSPNFVIQEKGNDPIAELIEKYKKHIRANGLKDEIYKWKLLAQFQGRPDITKADFTEELKSINFANLVYPVGIAVIHHIALERAEPYRECFKVLFNEEKPLSERVKYFNEETLKIYRELVPEEKFSHHQDERTIATFLTYHNPERYSFYKDSFYQKSCKLIDVQAKEKGEKYVHYMELLEEFINEYILEDTELLELIMPLIDSPDCFQDKNHLILAQDILYQTLDKQIGMDRAYWRIGTTDGTSGDATSYWEYMKTNKNVCIGWSELGDLNDTDITSKKNIESLFRQKGTYASDNRTLSRKAGEVFNFYNNIKVGDVVLAQNGHSILGVGIVTDEYCFDNKFDFPHQKQTEWKILNPKIINKEGNLTTVFKLTDISLLKQIDDLLKTSDNSSKDSINSTNMNTPLNQILFGPPGTGKTYNTINKSIAIANPNFDLKQPRKKIKEELERLMKEGQVVFTTFHQSMSYEDFIEGIKPLKPNQGDTHLKYDVLPGIFKKVCQDAKTPNLVGFDAAYENLKTELTATELLSLKTPTGKEFSVSLNSNDNLTLHTGQDKEKQGTLTKENIQKQINGEEKFKGWEGYFKGVINYLKTKFKYSEDESVVGKNYVLIIDEINRGNVSQIFGELITLIEEDKRLGKDEVLEVTLPYSKDKFSVPSNLYIIGTMNTADRSVEAIDTALRRRFSFEEVPPKYDLDELQYEFAGVKGFEILQTLNKRIEKLLDKDHQIGHSYFMKKNGIDVKEMLLTSFYKNIIPLLQEYFFGDFGKIGLVLGQGFVQKKEWSKNSDSFAEFDYESASEFDDRPVYEIIDHRDNDQADDSFVNAIKTLMNKKIG